MSAHNNAEHTAAATAAGGAAWDIENDALAHALSWVTRHHGRERSPESLLTSLGLTGRLGPDQAVRALRDAGFNAGLVQQHHAAAGGAAAEGGRRLRRRRPPRG
jgi:ATP-binding cassette subfamily C protein LapB